MIVLIDVDGVIVETGVPWLDWLCDVYSDVIEDPIIFKKTIISSTNWDLTTLINPFIENTKSNVDMWAYWRKPHLYDKFVPVNGAVEMHNKMVDRGHTPIFVSSCFSEHIDSKKKFIETYFDTDKFISCPTQHKHYIGGDVIIDDCPQTMINFLENTLAQCIQFNTAFHNLPHIAYDYNYRRTHRIRSAVSWKHINTMWESIELAVEKHKHIIA